MGKLDNLGPRDIDDGNQAGTRRQDRFARIDWSQIWVKCRESRFVEPNSKDLGEFLNAKRANGNREALEQALGIHSFLLINA
jgi:hypothetical protein